MSVQNVMETMLLVSVVKNTKDDIEPTVTFSCSSEKYLSLGFAGVFNTRSSDLKNLGKMQSQQNSCLLGIEWSGELISLTKTGIQGENENSEAAPEFNQHAVHIRFSFYLPIFTLSELLVLTLTLALVLLVRYFPARP